MSIIESFITANRRLCSWIDLRLPAAFKPHLRSLHRLQVVQLLEARQGQVVLEVGAGSESLFLPLVSDKKKHLIIGMDISEAELRRNRELTAKLVADATAPGLPLRGSSVDLIVSHSVIEHLPDNAVFFANCAHILRPGGMLAHTFPCRFAPFALINQLVPNWLARRLLAWFHSNWRQATVGFPAYYDHCYFSGIQRLLAANGFGRQKYTFRYYQSEYFDFFVPLYFIMLIYDSLIWYLGLRNLACGIIMTAVKITPEPNPSELHSALTGPPR